MANCSLSAANAAQLALDRTYGPWRQNCVARLDWNLLQGNSQGGLLGELGNPMKCYNDQTWGISKDVCDQYCSIEQMPDSARFDWLNFAQGFNSYLLPWMALTAQLPFQTGSIGGDIMSLMLAIGCPTLATFSLCITISNRRWAKRRLSKVYAKAKGHPATNKEWLLERITCVNFLLEEAQQEPLRINDRGDFHDFVTQEGESSNWLKLVKRLKLTRRGLTASLVVQNLVALLAWILTVVASQYSGDSPTQTSAGVLWMWLTPVVFGWVAVGVQTEARSVEGALDDAFESHAQPQAPFGPQWAPIRSNSVTSPRGKSARGSWIDRAITLPDDGQQRGPVYNYARASTWWRFAQEMEGAITQLIDRLQTPTRREILHQSSIARQTPVPPKKAVTVVTTHVVQPSPQMYAYSSMHEFLRHDPWRLVWPALMALFVQLGNTLGAFVMGYKTLPVGLGCNSGGYLLYGIGSTVAWTCLVGSALASHRVHYLKEQGCSISVWEMRVLSMLAATMLVIGKGVAVVNSIWLVLSTFFELGGLYATCYCLSSALGLGDQAWVTLWASQDSLTIEADNWWITGVTMAAVVCIGSMILFLSLSLTGRQHSV